MKSCAFFAALFLLGVGVFVGGFVYEVMYAGLQYQDATPAVKRTAPKRNYEEDARFAHILEVSGIAVSFGAIFGAAGWAFYRRVREGDGDDGAR